MINGETAGGFESIGIVGVGLIGGSIGLALRRLRPALRVLGLGRNTARLETALRMGAITGFSTDPASLSTCDLVVLASPVDQILKDFERIAGALRPGTVVTDVGSTKRAICRRAAEVLPDTVRFVGGHPIAGREVTGVENALAGLFEGAPWVLCPEGGPENSEVALESLVVSTGARLFRMTAEEHDRALARLSHVPQLVSTAMAAGLGEEPLGLAGSGLKSMLRLAGSSHEVWRAVFDTNSDNIDDALARLVVDLEALRQSLRNGNGAAGEFDSAAGTYKALFGRSASSGN